MITKVLLSEKDKQDLEKIARDTLKRQDAEWRWSVEEVRYLWADALVLRWIAGKEGCLFSEEFINSSRTFISKFLFPETE